MPALKRASRRAQAIYDRFNAAYFDGRLPRFTVLVDFKAGAPGVCDVEGQRIHLAEDEDDVEAAVLHETVHIVTGGDHDAAFRAELRRLVAQGEPAVRELAREEWHEAAQQEGARLALEEPTLRVSEVAARIIERIGEAPAGPRGAWATRGLMAWQNARARDSTG